MEDDAASWATFDGFVTSQFGVGAKQLLLAEAEPPPLREVEDCDTEAQWRRLLARNHVADRLHQPREGVRFSLSEARVVRCRGLKPEKERLVSWKWAVLQVGDERHIVKRVSKTDDDERRLGFWDEEQPQLPCEGVLLYSWAPLVRAVARVVGPSRVAGPIMEFFRCPAGGLPPSRHWWASRSIDTPLNRSQSAVVHKPHLGAVELIHGPPGTGKSHTITALLEARMPRCAYAIVCCTRNEAVAAITAKLRQTLRVVIVGPRAKVPDLLLDEQVEQDPDVLRWSAVQELKGSGPSALARFALKASRRARSRAVGAREEAADRIVRSAHVVCCTVDSLHHAISMLHAHRSWQDVRREVESRARWRLPSGRVLRGQGRLFDAAVRAIGAARARKPKLPKASGACEPAYAVVFDEAASSACWDGAQVICGARPKHLFLAGDPLQLRPFSHVEVDTPSFMERLMRDNAGTFLDTQYRMHRSIGSLVARAVYRPAGLRLHTGAGAPERGFVRWLDVDEGDQELVESSWRSRAEAQVVRGVVEELKGLPLKVWVLSFYAAQVKLLRSTVVGADVKTVDSCQGGEADVVVLSAVRNRNGIGFLKDRRRLNVALSRARIFLIIVGARRNFRRQGAWKHVVEATK